MRAGLRDGKEEREGEVQAERHRRKRGEDWGREEAARQREREEDGDGWKAMDRWTDRRGRAEGRHRRKEMHGNQREGSPDIGHGEGVQEREAGDTGEGNQHRASGMGHG